MTAHQHAQNAETVRMESDARTHLAFDRAGAVNMRTPKRLTDHAECHRDIDRLLAEIGRLRAVLSMCAEAGREAGEALVYNVERTTQFDGSGDD